MARLSARLDYEDLRQARILENKARLASLGLQRTISHLRSAASEKKSTRNNVRKYTKMLYSLSSLRRSNRLKGHSIQGKTDAISSLRRSNRLQCTRDGSKIPSPTSACQRKTDEINSVRHSGKLKSTKGSMNPSPVSACKRSNTEVVDESQVRPPANKPLLDIKNMNYQISPEASARRCNSKGRGSVYDPIFGISCHFCRQKKLCGEEDCKRCSNFDVNEPCIGKTDCSVCHSSHGVLCRACLKVRYGEEMEEVRENKEWMCPHCVEAKGLKPFWICNSSLCLKRRGIVPTGLAIFQARAMGYKSVAHQLMEELQRAAGKLRK